ncbi:hypothetical protein P3C58_08700 [Mesorhizobium sp. XAP10]|uniref:hypothetical protein n=1 Tax=unclassified Mesorhizobium TaxID=325217 RepID=UPI0023DEE895|nr:MULTISPECIES: hypothetical protein [unclassified Mesorhizobium]MDF3152054.1 hypothetical protein [Mesorhizobium sp. XAP10]MDF3244940.1 hypothetical protein [Mesorhizobium sp. XAP4]
MFSVRLDQPTHDALGILAKRSFLDNSALARKIFNDHLAKAGTGIAKELILQEVQSHDMTQFVTISFVAANDPEAAYRRLSGSTNEAKVPVKPFALFERDRPTGERLVKAYFSAMRRKFGSKGNLPALGVCETIKKNGVDGTFLHYHCLLAVPCAQEGLFRQASNDFWTKIGKRHFGAPITCQVERANSKEAVARYALKNVDDDYPIDTIIMVGFDPPASNHRGAPSIKS